MIQIDLWAVRARGMLDGSYSRRFRPLQWSVLNQPDQNLLGVAALVCCAWTAARLHSELLLSERLKQTLNSWSAKQYRKGTKTTSLEGHRRMDQGRRRHSRHGWRQPRKRPGQAVAPIRALRKFRIRC
jgi:hypothetical protein